MRQELSESEKAAYWMDQCLEQDVTVKRLKTELAAKDKELAQISEELIATQNTLDAKNKELESLREDAERWRDATLDPSGYAHLFNLLAAGKGSLDDLNKMADRIGISRRSAMAKGNGTGPREPLKGALAAIDQARLHPAEEQKEGKS